MIAPKDRPAVLHYVSAFARHAVRDMRFQIEAPGRVISIRAWGETPGGYDANGVVVNLPWTWLDEDLELATGQLEQVVTCLGDHVPPHEIIQRLQA